MTHSLHARHSLMSAVLLSISLSGCSMFFPTEQKSEKLAEARKSFSACQYEDTLNQLSPLLATAGKNREFKRDVLMLKGISHQLLGQENEAEATYTALSEHSDKIRDAAEARKKSQALVFFTKYCNLEIDYSKVKKQDQPLGLRFRSIFGIKF